MNITEVKKEQLAHLHEKCLEQQVDFESMKKLLETEKVKKLQKRYHYIQQTIDLEIENFTK